MNIAVSYGRRSPVCSDDATLQDLADSIVDASLAFPQQAAAQARGRALKDLDRRIGVFNCGTGVKPA